MSQENVEVVKVAYEAFARGGLDRYMEHFTADLVYRPGASRKAEALRTRSPRPA
jgi:ketosteroid isomerase-like protein